MLQIYNYSGLKNISIKCVDGQIVAKLAPAEEISPHLSCINSTISIYERLSGLTVVKEITCPNYLLYNICDNKKCQFRHSVKSNGYPVGGVLSTCNRNNILWAVSDKLTVVYTAPRKDMINRSDWRIHYGNISDEDFGQL
jgi:hypothetical protein